MFTISLLRLLLPAIVLFSTPVQANELKIGDVAPQFTELAATDGRNYATGNFAEADVLVICFTCNHCPYAVDYEDRLNALHKKWKDDDAVQLIAINSNHGRDESLDKMKERATVTQFEFPYLKDETQKFARSMSAVYTPEFFVLDRDRRLIYKGALDDSTDARKVTEYHVESAVEATLTGKPVAVKKVGARGCTIRFSRQRR